MERYLKILRESNSKISLLDGTIISGSTYTIGHSIPMAKCCPPIDEKLFNFTNSVTTKIIPIEVYFGTVKFDCNWIKSIKPNKVKKSAHKMMQQFKDSDGRLLEYTLPDLCYGFMTFSVIDHADLTDAQGIKLDDNRIKYELIVDYSRKSIPSIDYAVINNHSKEYINGQYLFIKASLGSLNTSIAKVIIPGYNPTGKEVESFITIKLKEDDAKVGAIKNAVRGNLLRNCLICFQCFQSYLLQVNGTILNRLKLLFVTLRSLTVDQFNYRINQKSIHWKVTCNRSHSMTRKLNHCQRTELNVMLVQF